MTNLNLFNNLKFSDVWENYNSFLDDYHSCELASYESSENEIDYSKPINNTITDNSVKTLYYLLYAKYGNSTIKSFDVNQFKYKVWTIIFTEGCTWEKKLVIQQELRALNEEDLAKGTSQVFNHANHPGTEPDTNSLDSLTYIDSQTVNSVKRGKLEQYSSLLALLEEDVTVNFINKFKNLFKQVVMPTKIVLYETEEN